MEVDAEQFISSTSFALKGHTFVAGDFLFLHSQATDQLPGATDQKAKAPEYAAKEGRYVSALRPGCHSSGHMLFDNGCLRPSQ